MLHEHGDTATPQNVSAVETKVISCQNMVWKRGHWSRKKERFPRKRKQNAASSFPELSQRLSCWEVSQLSWLVAFIPNFPSFWSTAFPLFHSSVFDMVLCSWELWKKQKAGKTTAGRQEHRLLKELWKGERVREAENLWVQNPWTMQICTTALVYPSCEVESA